MNKKLFLSLSTVLFLSTTGKAQVTTDSIKKELELEEVVVLAPYMERMNNYILIRPDSKQRKHSNNAYELLMNCYIPGVKIDMQTGIVEAMGASATLYMNGQPCDPRDLVMLRPRDIEKIEYHDIPSGKYINDRTAINFVVKSYRCGGYVLAKAQQRIGYNQGVYDLSSSLNQGRNTFTVFTGADYSNVNGIKSTSEENFTFDVPLTRFRNQESEYKKNSQYVQLRYQFSGKKNYLNTKLSLVNSENPSNRTFGMSEVSGTMQEKFSSTTSQSALSPKFDLSGEYRFTNAKTLNYGAHFYYGRNKYDRRYEEGSFVNHVGETEDVYSFNAACIYNTMFAKGTLTASVHHYHNIWDSHYTDGTELNQHLWKGESLAFLAYNRGITKKLYLTSRLGIDWLQYHLDGKNNLSQVTPRLNIQLQYQLQRGSLLYSANYVNSNYGTEVFNGAEIAIDRYMSIKGNPNLKKSNDFMTYLYYMQQFGKRWTLSAVSQYNFNHNYVTNDYYSDGDRIVKTFSNDANTHRFSEIIGLSCRVSGNTSVGGDIRYAHFWLDGRENTHKNSLTANINAGYYWREFSIKPAMCFAQRTFDFSTMTEHKMPINYSLTLTYSHKNLYASAIVASPFNHRKTETSMETKVYSQFCDVQNRTQYQYCNLSFSYTFDFGRKTKVIDADINKDSNSSLLKI